MTNLNLKAKKNSLLEWNLQLQLFFFFFIFFFKRIGEHLLCRSKVMYKYAYRRKGVGENAATAGETLVGEKF